MSGIRYDNQVTTISGVVPPGALPPMLSVPLAIVSVWAGSALAALYQDINLTVPQVKPIACDLLGNFGFYIAVGIYTYTVMSPGGVLLGTFNLTFPPGAVGPGGTPGAPGLPGVVTGAGVNGSFAVPGALIVGSSVGSDPVNTGKYANVQAIWRRR